MIVKKVVNPLKSSTEGGPYPASHRLYPCARNRFLDREVHLLRHSRLFSLTRQWRRLQRCLRFRKKLWRSPDTITPLCPQLARR